MSEKLKEMKFSKYNHKISMDNNLYLYNALSGGFCKVDEEFKSILSNCDLASNVMGLELLPDSIIDELISSGFLINQDIDEFKLIKSIHNISRYGSRNSLSLTLLPTMACNFRCTYCFERDKEYPNNTMTEEVMDAIIKFIDENLNDGGTLSISWFGGEPLVNFNIFRNLQNKINNIVKEKNLKLYAGIVTNGYLLTEEISNELVDLGIKTIQITIDGPKYIHDERRMLQNGNGTFDKIIKNILTMNSELRLGIRVNIEKGNIDSVPDFIEFINEVGISKMPNVAVYFAVVRDYDTNKGFLDSSCFSIKEFSKEEIELNKLAYEKGLNIQKNISPNLSVCAAVSPNSLLIEPDGTLKKCWSTVGIKDKAVGNLMGSNDNSSLYLKNQCDWYSWSEFENKQCRECNILPLCMGGCPYYSVNKHELFEGNNYRCITQKFNLEDTLKLIAYKYLDQKKQRNNA